MIGLKEKEEYSEMVKSKIRLSWKYWRIVSLTARIIMWLINVLYNRSSSKEKKKQNPSNISFVLCFLS